MTPAPRRVRAAIACWVLGVAVFALLSLFAWALRDGLGPGLVESHGRLALSRFLAGLPVPSFLAVFLLGLGFALYPWRKNRASETRVLEDQPGVWPPPITRQAMPVKPHPGQGNIPKRGLCLGVFSILFVGAIWITQWLPMWLLWDFSSALLLLGVTFSVLDMVKCRKVGCGMGVLVSSLGLVCNLLPFVLLTAAGIFD